MYICMYICIYMYIYIYIYIYISLTTYFVASAETYVLAITR